MRLDCNCRKGLSFDRVFIKPKRSALPSRDVNVERQFRFKHSDWEGIPIIAANMDHTGTIEMAKALNKFNMMTALHKFYDTDTLVDYAVKNSTWNTWFTLGMNALNEFATQMDAIRQIRGFFIPNICIDVANGYTQAFSDYVSEVRKAFPTAKIMAGNVATYEMTEQLIISGADIVKVGIGPGSVCTTRKMTGVGYPQLSAIDECADAAHGLGGMICADGGCQSPGDVAKALAAGADFVMLGGMLAGHKQCSGTYIFPDGSEYDTWNGYHESVKKTTAAFHPNEEHVAKDLHVWLSGLVEPTGMKFYGMSSVDAQIQHYGEVKEYRAAEGKSVTVPYRGSVENTVKEILGGIRSTMTYIGAQRLKDIPKCATFVLTNEQLNGSFS